MATGTKTWLLIGAVAVGAYLLFTRKSGGSGKGLQPAAVKQGEQVRAASYRVTRSRRPGLSYVAVEKGNVGAEITFTSPANATFTRNVVQEGNQLWAEMASA